MAGTENKLVEGLTSDRELVMGCLAGDREAFGRIVERYQRLLCSLAYSSTGNLEESEDLAQEVFLEGWRQLPGLREPEKLRSWLCGILRYKASRRRRSETREPVSLAEDIEHAAEVPSSDEPAAHRAMNLEEQAILWHALEKVPALYREPLVLYYREHHSVEHVAAALDLTEDAVKQRLARGRRMLQERVLNFVEGALARSSPGAVFTLGVLAALPAMVTPAKAAGVGVFAAQGGMIAKSTGLAALVASCSGVVSAVLALRANLDQSRTPRERRAVVRITAGFFFGSLGGLLVLYLLRNAGLRWAEYRWPLAVVFQVCVALFAVGIPVALVRVMRSMRKLRSEERRRHPELFRDARDRVGSPEGEYRSRWTLWGVPLVHVRYSAPDDGEGPVFGWIAGGDRAYGLLAAWGGWAVAPLSVGVFAAGIFSVGTVSVGVFSLGTVGVGLLAFGCVAVGVHAGGWLSALGWETAQGSGYSIARTAAEGPMPMARHAGDEVARRMLANPDAEGVQVLIFVVIALLTLIPVAGYAKTVRKRLGPRR